MSIKDRARAQAEKWFLGKIGKIDSEADRAALEGLAKWGKSNGVDRDLIIAQVALAEARIEANDGSRNCMEVLAHE